MAVEFTVQAMQDATEEPVLHLGRLVYRGRVLSAQEWFPFWDRYAALGDRYRALMDDPGRATSSAVVELSRVANRLHLDYLRAVFPSRRFRFWAPDPVARLARGHPKQLRDAFDAFFSLQARAMGLTAPRTESPPDNPSALPTDGTSSSGSTPVDLAAERTA